MTKRKVIYSRRVKSKLDQNEDLSADEELKLARNLRIVIVPSIS
jgi:hypothetical protein